MNEMIEPNRRAAVFAEELEMQADFEDSVIAEELFEDSIPAELLDEFEQMAASHKPVKDDVLLDFTFDDVLIRD